MILIDSNVPMYLVGADHPNKTRARLLLERVISDGERIVTDVEVLQEILHRCTAIGRLDAIEPTTEALLGIVDEVVAIDLQDVRRAALIVGAGQLSARDALHVAVMQRQGIVRIMSFDRGFDDVPGIIRVPAKGDPPSERP